jgi:hypothetical protein
MKIENGKQPVYPTRGESQHGEEVIFHGLTKREYFSQLAMTAILSNPTRTGMESRGSGVLHEEYLAKYAVCYADALLKQLEQ